MSLPDTVFIFVLALIIFGPKKLPEIGRQLGRLVGEFRRASNEFKYQIEEELRLVEISDKKRSTSTAIAATTTDEPETANSESADSWSDTIPDEAEPFPSESEAEGAAVDPAENIPVGQYPNPDYLNASEFRASDMETDDQAAVEEAGPDSRIPGSLDSESVVPDSAVSETTAFETADVATLPTPPPHDLAPTITPAQGIEPRTTVPFAATDLAAEYSDIPYRQPIEAEENTLALEAPANRHPAPTEAEVTHG